MGKIPEDVMIEIIVRALQTARMREYVKCFDRLMPELGDVIRVRKYCTAKSAKLRTFTASDFELEARKWMQENGAVYMISSLRRKLRRWAREGHVVKYVKPGVYEVLP